MDKTLNFVDYVAEHMPHNTAELICVRCLTRWIGVWPATIDLVDLICPHCNTRGAIITTGQILEDEYDT